jgi:hypothetical protein
MQASRFTHSGYRAGVMPGQSPENPGLEPRKAAAYVTKPQALTRHIPQL